MLVARCARGRVVITAPRPVLTVASADRSAGPSQALRCMATTVCQTEAHHLCLSAPSFFPDAPSVSRIHQLALAVQ